MASPLEIFKEIAKIPKCSKNASQMRDYIVRFGKNLGYECIVDSAQNVLCRTGGAQQVCLQAHYDMVCIGDTQNIELIEKDGFLMAKNSSLGADNCVGAAYMLSLMCERRDLEYLFTADEEIGLIGAKNIEIVINSKYVINTDTENEEDIAIGCAGGYLLEADFVLDFEDLGEERNIYRLKTKNFSGGHSGFDAHKGIKNAIKECGFFLKSLQNPKIISFDGGEKLNSIPKDVEVVFALDRKLQDYDREMFEIEQIEAINRKVYANSQKLIDILLALPSGVLGFDEEFSAISDSINLAMIKPFDNRLKLTFMGRANTNLAIQKNLLSMRSMLSLFGFEEIVTVDVYSAWEAEKSEFALSVQKIFKESLGKGEFRSVHAGFECGVLKEKFPWIEVVSIGPNIYNPHSLWERVEIASLERVFEALKKVIDSATLTQSHR